MAPESKDYKIIELEAENDHLKDEIIEMQRLKISELEQKLAKFLETGVERNYVSPSIEGLKHRQLLKTSSELARFLEQKSIQKVANAKKSDNLS